MCVFRPLLPAVERGRNAPFIPHIVCFLCLYQLCTFARARIVTSNRHLHVMCVCECAMWDRTWLMRSENSHGWCLHISPMQFRCVFFSCIVHNEL